MINRRDFLKRSGEVLGGISLSSSLAFVRREESSAQEIHETWVRTSCLNCPSWCPQEVKVVDGRAIYMRGNPDSLLTEGSICARAHLSLQKLYDPDRIKGPLRRTNPKKGKGEDPQWAPISWDEALEKIAVGLLALRERREIHKLALFRGRYTRANEIIYGSMMRILGSPNNISHSSICAESDKWGSWAGEGYWDYHAYDVERANYILFFGVDPITAHRPVSKQQRAWGKFRGDGHRGKAVVVDPRLSVTAAKADEWLPIRPGADGALALALSHVILREGLWDRRFVGDFVGEGAFVPYEALLESSFEETHTLGLIRWWNLELKDRTPEWAAEITSIASEKIEEVAVEMATYKPSFAWRGRGPNAHPKGSYNSYAIMALNALLGAIDAPGGLLGGLSLPLRSSPPVNQYQDSVALEGLGYEKIDQRGRLELLATNRRLGGGVVTNQVADSILAEDPYDIEMIIGYHCNFVFSAPDTKRWHKAMEKIPFFVHITPMFSEMSLYADIILPTPSYLEKWSYDYMKGGLYTELAIKQPVVERLWDTRSSELEIPYMLAERLEKKGFSQLKDYLDLFIDPETGRKPENEFHFAKNWVKFKTAQLWPNNSWEEFLQKGVYTSEAYPYYSRWDRFNTPSQKFEFVSGNVRQVLQEIRERHSITIEEAMKRAQYDATGEMILIPHYETPRYSGDEGEYPYHLITYKPHLNSEGRSMNNPLAQEIYLPHLKVGWENVAEINPQTAKSHGIEDYDWISVRSPVGEIQLRARLFPGIHPDVIAIAFGQGHYAYGRWANDCGANPNDIIAVDYDRFSGMTSFNSTRVTIGRA